MGKKWSYRCSKETRRVSDKKMETLNIVSRSRELGFCVVSSSVWNSLKERQRSDVRKFAELLRVNITIS